MAIDRDRRKERKVGEAEKLLKRLAGLHRKVAEAEVPEMIAERKARSARLSAAMRAFWQRVDPAVKAARLARARAGRKVKRNGNPIDGSNLWGHARLSRTTS